jgi:rhodanese-related sulfurtransferase
MTKIKFLMLSILFAVFLITSCSKDEENVNESQVLAEYLESTSSPLGKDYVNTDMPSIMPAVDVKTLNETGQIYIIDIRAAADFAAGHIENAHNVALADIVSHIESVDLAPYTKVAVVCYTGQTAGYAASLLRLLGYDKVFSMKWGMSSWHEDFDKWSANISNAYATQFTSTATEKGPMGDLPTLNTGKTTGQEILEARVDALLTEGFDPAKVTTATVFGALSDYYIVNYWPANQYADPGHIPGAIQYTPKESIMLAADLKTLPTDKKIAVYCYSGQTSAYLAAYLRLLGYDAKSILFGANGMIYDVMKDAGMTIFKPATMDPSDVMGYDYVQ